MATARKLEAVFSNSAIVKRTGLRVIIAKISDPMGFIEKIQTAEAVKMFKASFTGPNPIDPDDVFQRPFSRLAKETNAVSGETKLKGTNLDPEAVELIARSTAATGNEASARIQKNNSGKLETIHFNGDPVKLSYMKNVFKPITVLKDMLVKYKMIRG